MLELCKSPFFGAALSIFAFWIGEKIQEKTKITALNPLLIAILLIIGVLTLFRIPYDYYKQGGELINLFLAPATACLAVSIYTRLDILKENWLPVLVGCTAGSIASLASVYGLCRFFGLDEQITYSLLPKSVTTPIAISIASGHGGIIPITVVSVIFTGILGSIFAPTLIKLFRIKDPMAAGVSIGACSHAVGTSRAIQLGETEGAMSGLAIGICGIITVAASVVIG